MRAPKLTKKPNPSIIATKVDAISYDGTAVTERRINIMIGVKIGI